MVYHHTTGEAKSSAMIEERLSITVVARELGITTKTITRWEKAGKIRRAKRDWRGWRVYDPQDIEELKQCFQTIY